MPYLRAAPRNRGIGSTAPGPASSWTWHQLWIWLLLAGCAYHQSLSFVESGALKAPDSITISDTRSDWDRETHVGAFPCVRRYGDDFIAPTKLAYLKHLLASRSTGDAKLALVVSQFETTEYCEASAERGEAIAAGSAVGSLGHGTVFQVPSKSNGDVFILHLSGSINGESFDVEKGFDYRDLRFLNFPSENGTYRQRVAEVLDEAADEILSIPGAATPDH